MVWRGLHSQRRVYIFIVADLFTPITTRSSNQPSSIHFGCDVSANATYKNARWSHRGLVTCLPALKSFWSLRLVVLLCRIYIRNRYRSTHAASQRLRCILSSAPTWYDALGIFGDETVDVSLPRNMVASLATLNWRCTRSGASSTSSWSCSGFPHECVLAGLR
jgi:hypothetical protein